VHGGFQEKERSAAPVPVTCLKNALLQLPFESLYSEPRGRCSYLLQDKILPIPTSIPYDDVAATNPEG
jgi:hypothetical protein